MLSESEIKEVIKCIAQKYFANAEVLLFGSRATKNSRDDSDYDILIITEEKLTPGNKNPMRSKIRKELLTAGIRSDILIQSHEEIEKKKLLPGHIIRNIMREAILL